MGGLEESCQVGVHSTIDNLFVGIFALLLADCSSGWENVRIYVPFANLPSTCQPVRDALAASVLRFVET